MLDFSSSGQKSLEVSQLFSDHIQLINAIELIDWNGEQTQLLICEACGYVHCKSGGWVSLRSAGSLILILPAFDSYAENERSNDEYAPPWYIKKEGIAFFDLPTYQSLLDKHPGFPPVERIPKLNLREAILAFQWDAPFQVFGRPPHQFAYRNDLVIVSSEGDHTNHIRCIEEFAKSNLGNESPVRLNPLPADGTVVSLYLDGPEFTEWKAVRYVGSEMHLILGSQYAILTDT